MRFLVSLCGFSGLLELARGNFSLAMVEFQDAENRCDNQAAAARMEAAQTVEGAAVAATFNKEVARGPLVRILVQTTIKR